ncbi:glutamate synthase-related protein [Cupriavidus basilensis]
MGADEFGFATAPLVAEGCIMMRKCHLNTCPVGVATQDPVLRKKFQGKPEHVVNFFFFVAEEAREIMAQLGIRTFDELIGRADLLDTKPAIEHWKARGLDFSRIFYQVPFPAELPRFHTDGQDHGLSVEAGKALDHVLIAKARLAIDKGERVSFIQPVKNVNRTVGAMLSGVVAKQYGHEGLPDDTIHIQLQGTAGSPLAPSLAHGITLDLVGDGNDYVGKGLSGGPRDRARSARVPWPTRPATSSWATPCFPRRDCRRSLLQRRGGRTLRGAQLGRVRSGGRHRRPWLRVRMTGGTVVVLGGTGRNLRPACRAAWPTSMTRTACSTSAATPRWWHWKPCSPRRTRRGPVPGLLAQGGRPAPARRSHPQGPDRAALPLHGFRAAPRRCWPTGLPRAPQVRQVFPTEYKARAGRNVRQGAGSEGQRPYRSLSRPGLRARPSMSGGASAPPASTRY